MVGHLVGLRRPLAPGYLALMALLFAINAIVAPRDAARAEVITIGHPDPSEPTIYVMTVTPAPEPKPALKYHFLVPPVDRIHGNAATLYYKAMSYEGPDPNGPLSKVTSADDEEPSKALFDLPLSKFPQKQAEELVRWLDGGYFEWIRDAGRCDHCDWMDGIRQHGISTLLPQAQASRTTCWSLALRARLQIAQGKIDDAVETLRAGYGWSRNLSQVPTLIQCFIGNAFQELLNPQVCTLIGQENSPNLYWALTDLATEPIDFHEGAFVRIEDLGIQPAQHRRPRSTCSESGRGDQSGQRNIKYYYPPRR